MEQLTEREMVDLTNWTNDSPSVNTTARSHQKTKAKQSRTRACEEEEENDQDGEKDPKQERHSELLRKLQEAKKEAKAIEVSNFTCRHVRCPLCLAQMSESTSEAEETVLWCPNQCGLAYKANNEKARTSENSQQE